MEGIVPLTVQHSDKKRMKQNARFLNGIFLLMVLMWPTQDHGAYFKFTSFIYVVYCGHLHTNMTQKSP